MAKAKRKNRPPNFSPDFLAQADRAGQELLALLPTEDPAGVFRSSLSGLAGGEAALLDVLARSRSQEALDFLCALLPSLTGKARIKEVKRAIYRLEQVGMTATAAAKSETSAIVRKPAPREALGFLGEYDVSTTRMGVLAIPVRPSGYDAGMFLLSQTDGLREYNAVHVTEGELHRMVRELGRQSPAGLIPVPPAHVRLVLAEAVARGRETGQPESEDYRIMLHLIGSLPLLERPFIHDLLPADGVAEMDFETAVRDLVVHPMVAGLLPLAESYPYLARLEEVDSSVLLLSPAQKAESRQSVMDRARDEIFTPARRNILRRCLEETALLFWQTENAALAEVAFAATLKLIQYGDTPQACPVVNALVQQTFGLLFRTDFAQMADESSGGETDVSEAGIIRPGDRLGQPRR